ncbi:MAG: hypothetical protein J5507_01255 [Clostridia bacterium]|nr:hypothetical protein [Clostridia bacterium]
MKNFLRGNKGIGASDAIVAILIISLFTGLIATILYNIYISNTSLKRMGTANSYIIDILEYSDKLYYEDLTTANKMGTEFSLTESEDAGESEEENLERLWKLEGTINNGYNVEITLDKYTPEENSYDLVRKITVTISYTVGSRNQEISVYRIKSRENIQIPNNPVLGIAKEQLNIDDGDYIVYPVKYENENYIICTEDDRNWYKYDITNPENSNNAKIIISEEDLVVGDTVPEEYIIYEWIPRCATNEEEELLFLFSNSNNYVEDYEAEDGNTYQRLTPMPEGYTTDFEANQLGRWTPQQ